MEPLFASGAGLAYRDEGAGPALLALSANPGDSRDYDAVAAALQLAAEGEERVHVAGGAVVDQQHVHGGAPQCPSAGPAPALGRASQISAASSRQTKPHR